MKSFEALFKLANPDSLSDDEYYNAIKTIYKNILENKDYYIYDRPYAILYLNKNRLTAVSTNCYLEDNKFRSYIDGNEYNNIIDIISINELINDTESIKYEHWFGAGLYNEYGVPRYYSSYEDLLIGLCASESNEYFLEEDSFFIIPSYKINDKYVWNVFINDGHESYMCGRMTVS